MEWRKDEEVIRAAISVAYEIVGKQKNTKVPHLGSFCSLICAEVMAQLKGTNIPLELLDGDISNTPIRYHTILGYEMDGSKYKKIDPTWMQMLSNHGQKVVGLPKVLIIDRNQLPIYVDRNLATNRSSNIWTRAKRRTD